MASADLTKSEEDGAAVYNPATLAIYDLLVLRITNSYGWRCSRWSQLDLYNRHFTTRHLDIGPGTGWYLNNVALPAGQATVTLMDLNPNTMKRTEKLLADRGVPTTTHVGSVLQSIDPALGTFESVAAHFLFHCVPGTWENEKGAAIGHIAKAVSDSGVFFGTTVLGKSVDHNLFGKTLMSIYNGRTGIFHNTEDDLQGLTRALEFSFEDVEVNVEGVVAKFVARKPRR